MQLPEWASLPIERVPSSGTDNALYRLGDDMVVRLPRIHWAVAGLERELEWLPLLGPTPSGGDSHAARDGLARRRVPVAVGRLSVARR